MKRIGLAVVVAAVSLGDGGCVNPRNEKPEATQECFQVPMLERPSIDADTAKWGDAGFHVDLMPDKTGAVKPVSDFDAKCRLAWNDQGLLVLVTVIDDVVIEAPNPDDFWHFDSVEIYVARKRGAAEYCQATISPGVSSDQPKPRVVFSDRIQTPIPLKDLTAVVASRKTADGYVVEALLPWKNLGMPAPKVGEECAVQVMVNKPDRRPRDLFNAVWFPSSNASRDSNAMHVIRLGREASPPVGFGVSAGYASFQNIRVAAAAGLFATGTVVTVKRGDHVVGTMTLAPGRARAEAELLLPMPPHGDPCLPLEIFRDFRPVKTIALPNADTLRIEALVMERMACDNSCFDGRAFPTCDFTHPDLVARLIGPYTLQTTFYDAAGNPVTNAAAAGRFGAVVEITPSDGRPLRRFCTLFRSDGGTEPQQAGIASATEADRQWWVTFKRRYYGLDKVHPSTLVCPVPGEGTGAPTLRDGSPAEAGMTADAADGLDAVCREWVRVANEPFSVCLARRGVIFFHRAYGTHDGVPVETTTQVRTASTAKFPAAILMMELVDQGLVDLDRTVDTYVPALRGVPCARRPTVRDLYLHVTGLPGQLGDDRNDIEELVAACYPEIRDVRQSYQNTGLALGGKIVEMISGEVHPAFCRKHLLQPLGCVHTEPGSTASGVLTTTGDLAIIGQMMLNGGAYGPWRFLRDETVRQFATQPGRDRIGPDKAIRWGIGTKLYDSDKLSAAAIGHPGANGDFVFVDPARGVVATMLRWSEGRDYLAFRARLFSTLFAGIAAEDRPVRAGQTKDVSVANQPGTSGL